MTTYLISAAIGIVALLLGEQIKPNETKITYEKRGYNWNKVLLVSILSGAFWGILSSWLTYRYDVPSQFNPQFLPFVSAITAYVTAQSFFTDIRVFLINRKLLRVAYISTYIVSVYNVVTNDFLRINWTALVLFTIVLIIIFFLSSIGASDVRMMAVAMPYTISIGGYSSILLFIFTLLIVAGGMQVQRTIKMRKELQKYKENHAELLEKMSAQDFYISALKVIKQDLDTSEEHAVAIGPYMLIPFLIYLTIYPVLL